MQTLTNNLRELKKLTSAKICAVVKADAYGLGIKSVTALSAADEFAVSCLKEAYELLEFTSKPINILSLPDKSVHSSYSSGIYPSVSCDEDIEFVRNLGASAVNLKINTGMNRYGAQPEKLGELLKTCDKTKLGVKSVFSHIYDLSAAKRQFELFIKSVEPFSDYIPQKHILSSNFAVLPQYMHLDMVRPGIVLYGYGHSCVSPPVTAECSVTQVRDVYASDNVGYGRFISGKDRKIAVLSAGYADGIRRITDNSPRYVCLQNHLCRVLGQVCMDATIVDVSGLDVSVGDKAFVLCNEYGANSVAASCGTICYEILTGFGKRVIREYV